MFLFYTPWKRVKKENIGLKWVDNSGRGIIIIQNNAALIYGINRQNTNSIRASNNIVINGVTIFISEKFKGSCEWYFKSDIAGFQFDNTNIIKIKTFIDKIRNLTTFFIFFSFSFKSLMASSIDEGRPEGYERSTFDTDLLIDDRSLILFFPFSHQIITKIVIWMLAGGRTTKTSKRDIASMLRHESSGGTSYIIFISPCPVEFWIYVSYDCLLCLLHDNSCWQVL